MTEKKPTRKTSKKRGRPSGSSPIDKHVGHQLRVMRTLRGLSQDKLGQMMGLTFQQIQKYERGMNRIGVSRLYDLSRVLDVSVTYFFENMSANASVVKPTMAMTGSSSSAVAPVRESVADAVDRQDILIKRETLELVRAYHGISNEALRKRVFELCKALADEKPKRRSVSGKRLGRPPKNKPK